MAGIVAEEYGQSGFSFVNCRRNQHLVDSKRVATLPTTRKTGTTIVAVQFKDGVVLGADTRATEGSVIADKFCSKIAQLAPNIYACGAGTAADLFFVTEMIASKLVLHSQSTGREARVATAATMLTQHLFRYGGHLGVALLVGGVDVTGPNLYSVHPSGFAVKLPYSSFGSGSLAAMSVLETNFRRDLEEADARKIVKDAVLSGIYNDLGSGNSVDLCVLRREGINNIRTCELVPVPGEPRGRYMYKEGTTPVLRSTVKPVQFDVVEAIVQMTEGRMEE